LRFVPVVGYARAKLGHQGDREDVVVVDAGAVGLLNAGPLETAVGAGPAGIAPELVAAPLARPSSASKLLVDTETASYVITPSVISLSTRSSSLAFRGFDR
jgi:hypothetical protein